MISNYNIVILNELQQVSSGLNQEIDNYVSSGGTVILFPGNDFDIESYNRVLQPFNTSFLAKPDTQRTKISKINYDCNILKNVFRKQETNILLPVVYHHFVFKNIQHSDFENILSDENNDNILSCYPYHSGKMYLFAMPLDDKWTNFTRHPLFVPVIYNIVSNSLLEDKLYYIIGTDESVDFKDNEQKGDNIYHISDPAVKFDFIPEQRFGLSKVKLFLHHQIKFSGNYSISYKNNVLKAVAFNYNRKESDLQCYSKKEISELLKRGNIKNFSFLDVNDKYLGKTIKELNEGLRLWKFCILLALLFIAIEILIIRFFSKL